MAETVYPIDKAAANHWIEFGGIHLKKGFES
jgi:hypothetical protein